MIMRGLVSHLLYVNALQNRTDGRFILMNQRRLQRNLAIYFKGQMNYVLKYAKEILPAETETNAPLKTNKGKKEIRSAIQKMPYKDDIAKDLYDYEENTLKRGAKTTITRMNLGKFGIGYDVVNKKAADYLGEKLSHELSDAKGTIHDSTVDRIVDILYDGYEQGKSYKDISKEIQEQAEAGIFSQARGELIATREIGLAYEEGNFIPLEAVQEENPDREVVKYWSTVNDDRVTEAHMENQNEGWVPLDFIYEASGGDEHAPGSDNPRCRCTQLYDIR